FHGNVPDLVLVFFEISYCDGGEVGGMGHIHFPMECSSRAILGDSEQPSVAHHTKRLRHGNVSFRGGFVAWKVKGWKPIVRILILTLRPYLLWSVWIGRIAPNPVKSASGLAFI